MSIHNQQQKEQETHNQAGARAVTFRAASPVLLMQLWSHSADAAAPATQGCLRKCGGRQRGDTGITFSHSRFPTALRQPPPHPASKKFRTFIGILARSAHRRLRPFLWAAWIRVTCGLFTKAPSSLFTIVVSPGTVALPASAMWMI